MIFLSDLFADTTGTLLENHTPDTGGPWVKVSGDANNRLEINGNRLMCVGGQGAEYINDEIAPDADVDVIVNADFLSDVNMFFAFGARCSADLSDAVWVAWNDFSNTLVLSETVNGVDNELDSVALTTADQELRLELRGTAAKVYRDELEVLSGTTAVEDAGYVAFNKFGGPGASDGAMFLDISAETVAAGPPYQVAVDGIVEVAGTADSAVVYSVATTGVVDVCGQAVVVFDGGGTVYQVAVTGVVEAAGSALVRLLQPGVGKRRMLRGVG